MARLPSRPCEQSPQSLLDRVASTWDGNLLLIDQAVLPLRGTLRIVLPEMGSAGLASGKRSRSRHACQCEQVSGLHRFHAGSIDTPPIELSKCSLQVVSVAFDADLVPHHSLQQLAISQRSPAPGIHAATEVTRLFLLRDRPIVIAQAMCTALQQQTRTAPGIDQALQ